MRRIRRLVLVLFAASALAAPSALGAERMWIGFHDDPSFRWVGDRASRIEASAGQGASVMRLLVHWDRTAPTRPARPADPFDPGYKLDDLDDAIRTAQANDMEVLSANKPCTRVEQTTNQQGNTQYWLSFKFPLVDPQGTRYLAGVSVNVTEEKRLEAQLRRTERIAELGTLASGMAHEIGTPMNVILGRAEYLLQKTSDESMKKGLSTIISQVERITRVMNQLLAFARRKPQERGTVDLKELIEDALDMFHERLSRHRIVIEQTVDGSLQAIAADRDQLMQVLINLIVNSLHAMDRGGTLRLAATRTDDLARLEISDTGQGIPPEILSRIFDPFFTTKEFGKGTGLGLTVVKGIVEEHGGTISVDSRVGEGTTVAILLPLDSDGKPGDG